MFRNISAWSIRNPVPTILLFVVLTIAGTAGFLKMRVNNFPDISFPLVVVSAGQPGAAPPELETQVTRVIEDSLAGLDGVRHIRSTVGDGVSATSVEFNLGVDLERATNDVRNAVSKVRANLPQDIPEPNVQRIDISGQPLITYVVRAPTLNPEQISWFVDNDVTKTLLSIQGVGQVNRDGGVSREIRVKLDPDRLAAMGVTAAQISGQLKAINANLPGGRATLGGEERSIRTLGGADTVEQLKATRINLPDGRTLRLGDVAIVEDAWGEPRSLARFNGEPVVGFSMLRTRDGSEVAVSKKIRAALAKLDASRADLKIEEVTSTVQYVEDSYDASMEALGIGAVLAVLVVWLFLRDWRATVITSMAIPLSLIPTFAILAPLNQSFNVVTLLALSLTIGILVDDAIVEIENIVRHIREGKAPYPAAMEAADEIGLAVVATTFTILAVFAPVGFMGGVVGQFFKSFALAACVSVAFSLLVARMMTPLMGAYFLRSDAKPHGEPFWMARYLKALEWSLRHRLVAFFAGILLFIGAVCMLPFLPFDFIPNEDQGYSTISVELPPGSTLGETDRVVGQLTTLLRQRKEISAVYASEGSSLTPSGPGGGGGALAEVRRATVTAVFVPRSRRDFSQIEIERQVAEKARGIPGARIRFGADGSNPGISIVLTGDNGATLAQAARSVERQMRAVPGLANVVNTADIARPEILVTPKLEQAALLGVSAQAISQTVRVATIGDVDQLLPKFNLGDRQIPIRLTLTDKGRDDLSVLQTMQVPTLSGGSVPLNSVADIQFGSGPSQIDRTDRSRSATIQAELNGLALGEASQKVNELPAVKQLPPGVKQEPAGDVESLIEMVTNFILAFFTGILLMYAVLVLLFKSFFQPITIQAALPLAIAGAFAGLLIAGRHMSMPALIGILMLMGIAAKNSILLVEYAIEAMKKGVSRHDALVDAAHKRARPIVMTTVAMGVGMMPVALSLGANAGFRAPMAIAVIGGLITSTLLSLLYVPVVFVIVDIAETWLRNATLRKLAPQTEMPPPSNLVS
ncbi:HAE1 family hydrophobic/amphiphilic exporter-1 [Caulobacter ginsengisoli]|uniref:HAE1 family hydrophobic/amphiphilic exporter-1 n=1 Tax=Caulobacter ginsengisoli TaxID=400775 RepID=A0ABU0IQH9_9CAUL|nr:efflux RND transporter permease subunit [Caulobacter ginsengisoli]MDQ0464268.1 HAE1 family hydrophobic/amphiphilic exporter-1 [Caulobacter ginsengisoli]